MSTGRPWAWRRAERHPRSVSASAKAHELTTICPSAVSDSLGTGAATTLMPPWQQ